MFDLRILIPNTPGALAHLTTVLGDANLSIEGGGAFSFDDVAICHYLFVDGPRAQAALVEGGFNVEHCRPVLLQRLNQEKAGRLASYNQRFAEAGVNIEVQYSDHNGRLVVLVDDMEIGRTVSDQWTTKSGAT